MCGRYMIASGFEAMADLFGADVPASDEAFGGDVWRPNVSPTETIPVCVHCGGRRQIVPMRWGFLPGWYRTMNGGPLLINARSEGIADRPAFGEAVRERRCLIPADGFYEWQGEKGRKSPWVIKAADGGTIAFAGVWQAWRGIETCAIVTCAANATLEPIHERMPVVIEPANFGLWLGEEGHGAARLMLPAAEDRLEASPADQTVRANLMRRLA